jgi:hypothetical protein
MAAWPESAGKQSYRGRKGIAVAVIWRERHDSLAMISGASVAQQAHAPERGK